MTKEKLKIVSSEEEEQNLLSKLQTNCKVKLDRHRGKKRHWNLCSFSDLFLYLSREVEELKTKVMKGESEEQVWLEAADVANFAAMVAANYSNSLGCTCSMLPDQYGNTMEEAKNLAKLVDQGLAYLEEDPLITKLKKILPGYDSIEVKRYDGTMFVFAGTKRHTTDPEHIGEWIDENGDRIDFEYTDRQIVASGGTEQELLESAERYAALLAESEK